MGQLRLHFLGTPEVWYHQRQLRFATRKALSLLIYLSVAGGWHSREKLIALLWPDSDAAHGQASLRNTLARLRQALGEAREYILSEAELLSFRRDETVSLDLKMVTAAAGAAEPGLLLEAARLCRGEFLEGFSLPDAPSFDDWAGLEREYWHRQVSDILDRLSQLYLDEGNIRQAVETASRWAAHDPLSEAAHRRLMEAHAGAGDRAAALQAYLNCSAILAAELGVAPSPETEALAEQVRALQAARPTLRTLPADQPSSSARRSFDLPMVGRAVKHLQLVTAFYASQQGQPQPVLIEGEAGIGKTRLATEFLAWAETHGADVLQGRTFETGGRLPYQPLVEALRRRVAQENAPGDWLSDVWLAELSRLLPELRDRYPDLPSPTADEALARTRLPEAVARLGQALAARRQPIILFIDDLQWIDVASLDLLSYCLRSWSAAGSPIMLLLTQRPEARAGQPGPSGSNQPAYQAAPDPGEWWANLARDIPVRHLTLGPLTVEDTRQLAQALVLQADTTGLAAAQRLAGWLFAETKGQPFFITETIKLLVEQGLLQWQLSPEAGWTLGLSGNEPWLGAPAASLIPPGVRQLILTRLKRLAPEAASLLAAASVIGRDCSYSQLCQVTGLAEVEGLPGLDELLNSRLLVETGEKSRPYAIAHDKIREVVYTGAGAARRRIYHERALRLLEAAAAPPAELAHHALAAQLDEAAFYYSLAAGNEGMAVFAVREAIAFYEQARALKTVPPAGVDHQQLYLGLGRAYELAGDLKLAQATYQELLQLAQALGQVELVCIALNHLATVAIHAFTFEAAATHLQQALQAALESHYIAGQAEAEWGLAQLYHHRFDFQQSLVHSERALSLARSLGNQALVAGSLNSLAYAQILSGQVSTGEANMAEAAALYEAAGNRALEADCLTAMAAAQIWQGHTGAGIKTARAAEAICTEIGNPWGYIYSRVWLAAGLLDQGEVEAALEVAQAGQRQAEDHHLPAMGIFSLLILGKVYQELHRPEAAYQAHLTAQALNEQVKSTAHVELIAAELCTDCVLMGDWEAAIPFAREAVTHRRYASLPLVMLARWPETAALLRSGAITQAGEDARRWGELAGHLPRFRVAHLRSLAVLAEWREERLQAITHLEEAAALAEEIGLPGEQWQILAALAGLYRGNGDEEKARQAVSGAVEIIQHLAAKIQDAELRASFLMAQAVRQVLGTG